MANVSVVIPTRNALAWLPAAIASIGDTKDVEIIVVNDGSTDGTTEFLEMRSKADSRIRALNGPCKGPSEARNVALAVVETPYVAFLDADDRWRPGKLETQLILHEANPHIGMSFTDYMHHTPEGEDRGGCLSFWPCFKRRFGNMNAPFVIPGSALGVIYAENIVGTSTVVAKTDLLRKVGGFETSMRSAEDWDLWLKLAAEAPVGCIPWVAGDYMMHRPGNVSQDMAKRARAMRHFADKHRNAVSLVSPEAIQYCEARVLIAEAEAAAASGDRIRAAWYRVKASSLHPTARHLRETIAEFARAFGYTGRAKSRTLTTPLVS